MNQFDAIIMDTHTLKPEDFSFLPLKRNPNARYVANFQSVNNWPMFLTMQEDLFNWTMAPLTSSDFYAPGYSVQPNLYTENVRFGSHP